MLMARQMFRSQLLLVEHSNFRDFLLGKTSNVVTLYEGCETVRVADAIVESGRIQQVVSL